MSRVPSWVSRVIEVVLVILSITLIILVRLVPSEVQPVVEVPETLPATVYVGIPALLFFVLALTIASSTEGLLREREK